MTVQRRFCTKYQRIAPTDKTIHAWYNKLETTGCLHDAKQTGRPGHSAESVNRVRETFARSLRKSTRRASRELQMSQPAVWRILRKHLNVRLYRLQLLQALSAQDHNLCTQFCVSFKRSYRKMDLLRKLFF